MWKSSAAGLFSATLSIALFTAVAVVAAPAVTETINYYDVPGSTPREVRASLNKLGPIDKTEKQHFDAVTRWHVKWRYQYRRRERICAIAGVSTIVTVTITMPRLRADDATPPTLKQAFADNTEKLLVDERGHARIGIEIARRIEGAIRVLPTEPTCERLGQVANERGRVLIKEANQQDIDYDARTRHGRTQGVWFP
jgi:predicted secreted Zn-dependent protease